MTRTATLQELLGEALEAIPYPDLQPTSITQGTLDVEDNEEDVEYSEEYTFTAGTLLDEPLEAGGWVELGGADEQKPAKEGTVEAWGRSPANPINGWYGLKKGLRGRFGVYIPPLMEALPPPPGCFSSTMASAPASRAPMAADAPAPPKPTTTMSVSLSHFSGSPVTPADFGPQPARTLVPASAAAPNTVPFKKLLRLISCFFS